MDLLAAVTAEINSYLHRYSGKLDNKWTLSIFPLNNLVFYKNMFRVALNRYYPAFKTPIKGRYPLWVLREEIKG